MAAAKVPLVPRQGPYENLRTQTQVRDLMLKLYNILMTMIEHDLPIITLSVIGILKKWWSLSYVSICMSAEGINVSAYYDISSKSFTGVPGEEDQIGSCRSIDSNDINFAHWFDIVAMQCVTLSLFVHVVGSVGQSCSFTCEGLQVMVFR